jgi:hypothetical protein
MLVADDIGSHKLSTIGLDCFCQGSQQTVLGND